MVGRVLDDIAEDLGLVRVQKESNAAFASRAAYSALRFWMQAFCLDDGYGGVYGIDGKTVERKSAAWLETLARSYPDIRRWFGGDDRAGIKRILSLMVSSRNLIVTDEGLYRCVTAHTEWISDDCAVLSGLADPTDPTKPMRANEIGVDPLPFSGLTSAVSRQDRIRRQDPVHDQGSWGDGSWSDGGIGNVVAGKGTRTARIQPLDERHCLLTLNAALPSDTKAARLIGMVSWPQRSATDALHRVFRREYTDVITHILKLEDVRVR
ncbi:hypothetical protein [Bifidobacterium simiarum]|uniref:Uncharacterized protein n=1 Tax=Bifidobacterium simiarum TaxID=2045441 RepID=A0A2M9HD78_9BIFI|nr:hypothetical protein [Bifidobacterium simiarum]PJM74763.1 hypothetical protein CSQ87_08520 [Bifidobacterium simiarum]